MLNIIFSGQADDSFLYASKSYLLVNDTIFTVILDDFKPASVDTSRPAELVVGEKDEITVTVPHVQVKILFFINPFAMGMFLKIAFGG